MFLSNPEPTILAIKGKWGVGKTFLVRKQLKESSFDYAYVSLFGVESLEDLQEAIMIQLFIKERGSGSLSNLAKDVKKSLGKYGELANLVAKALTYQSFDGAILCIDDVERRGDDLSLKNLFGFLQQMKEQSRYRVLLVLNENELAESKEELDRYREKVIDREIELSPTPVEIVEHGGLAENKIARDLLQKLKADNIRAIQKIKNFLERLAPLLKSYDEEVKRKMTHSAVLLGWFYFVKSDTDLTLKFIETFDRIEVFSAMWERSASRRFGNEKPEAETEEQKKLRKLTQQLEEYGYSDTGPLEKLLIAALKQGSQNETSFAEVFKKLDSEVRKDKALQKLKDADAIFETGFEDDEQEYVSTLVKCFQENSKYYSPSSLEWCRERLKQLGRDDEAQAIFEAYSAVPHSFEPSYEYTDFKRLKDEKVKQYVSELLQRPYEEKNMFEVVEIVTKGEGNFPRYIEKLKTYSVGDWYNFLKSDFPIGEDVWFYIGRILEPRKRAQYEEAAVKAATALRNISEESKMNALRVATFEDEIAALLDRTFHEQ